MKIVKSVTAFGVSVEGVVLGSGDAGVFAGFELGDAILSSILCSFD